ncbi:MAG: lysophospholipid acyltransferase family protein [Solirubrobacterales bacterium]
MREIFSQALRATRATASVMARDLVGSRPQDALAERDPRFIRETLPAYSRAAQLYFRPKVRGLEQIPAEGPVLLVGNHSGGTLIADTFAFAYGFYNYFGPDRLFHQLAHDLVFRVPGLATLRRYGTIPANHENAMKALGNGAALLVYPGGDHETYRPSWHSGEIDFAHRSGFVRLALAADVPIVPVVAIGGQETALFLTRGERVSRLLALDRLLRLKVFPIQIAPPFGVTVLDLPGRIPLPSQITIQVLPRIDLRRRFGPQPDEDAVYHAVTTLMQEALDELSTERELPVVGTLGSRQQESEVVEDLEHGGLEREVEAAIEGDEATKRGRRG